MVLDNNNQDKKTLGDNIAKQLKQNFNNEWFVLISESTSDNFDYCFSEFKDKSFLVFGYKQFVIHALNI